MQTINIRTIQHFLHCPHQWGLGNIEQVWQENYSVVKANILHEKVHSGEHEFSNQQKSVFSDVPIYNDNLEIYGVADCLEFPKNGESVRIIEYKPTSPKDGEPRESDVMQVFVQKICVDYVFHCNSEGYLYFADTRKRIKLPLFDRFGELYQTLVATLAEMRQYLDLQIVPPINKGQKCNGCSFIDVCLPKTRPWNTQKEIERSFE